MRAEYFFGFTISSIIGVALETTLPLGYSFSILCAFLALIVPLLRTTTHDRKQGYLVSVILLGCAVGVLSVNVSAMNRNVHSLDPFLGRSVRIDGVVNSEPDVRETNTNIVLLAKTIKDGNVAAEQIKPANILLHVPSYPVVRYGDVLSVTGKIAVPKNFASIGGERPFDYRAYLAKDDIYYEMPFSKVVVTGENEGNFVLRKLFDMKQMLGNNIARLIPEPESSLAGGILLGTKQSLGTEWMQKFRDAGLAHIVVLSGYNIAVVANVIARLAETLPFGLRLGSSAVGIILFALMVGGGATVLRATLMALVVILARLLGRESEALRVLIFVGWLMVMLNPAILLSDVSFQLSFMAALALVVLAPLLEKYFLFVKYKVLREIVVTTIATQIFVAPILLYHMGTFSLVGLVANLFVLPIISIAMFFVAAVAVLSFVPLVGSILAYVAQFLLSYILNIVELGASIPFANVKINSFDILPLTICYGLIYYGCTMLKKKQSVTSK